MCSSTNFKYRLSWYCYTHLLATVARHQLNKKGGHSSEEDRQKLFTEACERYQLSGKILLADREFIGEKWLSFLVNKKINFIIRMSKTCYKKSISESLGFVYWSASKSVGQIVFSTIFQDVYQFNWMVLNTYTLDIILIAPHFLMHPHTRAEVTIWA